MGSLLQGEEKSGRFQWAAWLPHLTVSALSVILIFTISQFTLDGLKGLLADMLFRTQWWNERHPDVMVVSYEPTIIGPPARSPKFPVDDLVRAFEVLKSENPKAVGVLGPINEKNYSEVELSIVADALKSIPNSFVGYTDDETLGKPTPNVFRERMNYLPGFISKDTYSYGADSVSRRVMVTIDGVPTIYSELARAYRAMPESEPFANVSRYGKSNSTLQTYIHWQGPPVTYEPVTLKSLLKREFAPGAFRNKVVLIGLSRGSDWSEEYLLTPYSREPNKTSLLEGAAQSLATLMRNNGLVKSPPFLDFLLAFSLAFVTANLSLVLSPGRGILAVVTVVLGLTIVAWMSLFGFGIWLNLAHPIVAAFSAYYLVIPYRLINEYRKRWHYQEKSELMAQLEQLKSNFLSLVSHDLKTPIARIQGNTELLLSDDKKLDEKQKRSLSAILSTTEDLGEYVQTILDLTRIESAHLPIDKSSKDINSTIAEVVESKRFLATEKNITLETELEPLFSFKFDIKLIHRVLSNLVENAIKYSPPNTTIVLSSKDEGKWIKVSVADQGFGIPGEDQNKVFGKFFRCSNDSTRNVKGTGLGLYLVKYFVELHTGIVELKSELGKGSIFTISLPVE